MYLDKPDYLDKSEDKCHLDTLITILNYISNDFLVYKRVGILF